MNLISDNVRAELHDPDNGLWDQAYWAEEAFKRGARAVAAADDHRRARARSLVARLAEATDPEEVERYERKIAEVYRRDFARLTAALHALEGLTEWIDRVEFAAVAYRYAADEWPRVDDLAAFMAHRFGWKGGRRRIDDACDHIDPDSGVFIFNESWLMNPICFDVPDDGNTADRVVIGAEAQADHRLHDLYERWSFDPVLGEVTR